VAEAGAFLLTACEKGHGKRTRMEDYPIKGRGGQGVINIRTAPRNGPVVSVKLCREGDDVMYITEGGMIVRSHVRAISAMGRNTQGVKLVNVKEGDRLVAIEVIAEDDLDKFGADEAEIEAPPESAADAPDEAPGEDEDDQDGDGDGEGEE
jgi:DNA gyrase subunit A